MNLLGYIKKDFSVNSCRSAIALLFYRLSNYIYYNVIPNTLFQKIILKVLDFFWGFFKVTFNINSQISYKAKIGHSLRLPHTSNGVIISDYAIIGDNVTIFHQVTIGIKENIKEKDKNIYRR